MALRMHCFRAAWVGLLIGCGATPTTVPQSPCVVPSLPQAVPPSSVTDPGWIGQAELAPPARWLVLGTFPNPTLNVPTPSGATRAGVDRDYLEPIGGEATAVITPEIAGRFTGSADPIEVRVAKTGATGMVELDRVFPKSSSRILYAYAELVSDRDQNAFVHFGVDDSAKVWVNGRLVHDHFHPGRPVTRWAEELPVALVKGSNRILVKVDNGWLGAGFIFEPFTAEAHASSVADRAEQEFGNEKMVFADGKGFVRDDRAQDGILLPDIGWDRPGLAGAVLGTPAVLTNWYGPDGRLARVAAEPGLYTAIASYQTKAGKVVHRALPLLRTSSALWKTLGLDQPRFSKPPPINAADWKSLEPTIVGWAGGTLKAAPEWDASTASLLSEVTTRRQKAPADLGNHGLLVRWQQQQLDLKRRILGLGDPTRVGPARRPSAAPVLRSGTAKQAGIKPEALVQLRQIASEWAKTDAQPFVLAVARHGVVFMHEALGMLEGKPLPLDHRFYPASIGKNFTAMVFAQFMERDWLKPSQLVGEVLASWPKAGPKAVTFRQLFDHTAGLHGHTSYSGLDQPWLEEVFAAHVLPSAAVGARYEYEGDGGNIAAKAMELIDGRAFPILQREALFTPLGANSIDQWDCGWAAAATVLDIAKVAQMLLQKGAYGDWQFFSEKTWQALLPVSLATLYPNLGDSGIERGIGLEHSWDPEDESVAPLGATPLQPKKLHTVGHGSASSSIYRIDYQHDLVIVAGRISAPDGDVYDRYLHRFIRALEHAVAD